MIIFEFYFLLQTLYLSILFDLPNALQMDVISNLYWNSAKLKPSLMNQFLSRTSQGITILNSSDHMLLFDPSMGDPLIYHFHLTR